MLVPCQQCRLDYQSFYNFFICEKCSFRVCLACISLHKGKYGTGGIAKEPIQSASESFVGISPGPWIRKLRTLQSVVHN